MNADITMMPTCLSAIQYTYFQGLQISYSFALIERIISMSSITKKWFEILMSLFIFDMKKINLTLTSSYSFTISLENDRLVLLLLSANSDVLMAKLHFLEKLQPQAAKPFEENPV